MNKKLIASLKLMTDLDFRILFHHVQMANWVRSSMRSYGISESDMADKLKVSILEMPDILNAVYPFDIEFLSRIEVLDGELAKQYAIDNPQVKISVVKS